MIRLTKKDRERISKTNRNLRSKDRRLKEKFGNDIAGVKGDQPFNYKYAKDFKTRKEFNNYLKQGAELTSRSNSFTKLDSIYVGVIETKLVKTFQKLDEVVKKQSESYLKSVERISKGNAKLLGRGETIETNNLLLNKQIENYRTKEGIKAVLSKAANQKQTALNKKKQQYREFKESYYESIESTISDEEVLTELKEKLSKLTPSDMATMYQSGRLPEIKDMYHMATKGVVKDKVIGAIDEYLDVRDSIDKIDFGGDKDLARQERELRRQLAKALK